jgi:uncharacterized protein (TIGR03086 family)
MNQSPQSHDVADDGDLRDSDTVIGLFRRSASTFRGVLDGVRPEHHDLATPCEPLDVAKLVVKTIGHQDWTRSAIEGHSGPPAYPHIDPRDWTDRFDQSADAMVTTLSEPDAMRRTVTLAAGLTFPGHDVGLLAARNTFQFSWDLATATGQNTDLDPTLAVELLEISRTHLVPQRGPNGFFGPEYVPPAGAPTATVLAGYLGRPV